MSDASDSQSQGAGRFVVWAGLCDVAAAGMWPGESGQEEVKIRAGPARGFKSCHQSCRPDIPEGPVSRPGSPAAAL
jgi:hypothetical protein